MRNLPATPTGWGNTDINVALRGKVSLPRHLAWRRAHLPLDAVDLCLPCVTWNTHEESLLAGEEASRGNVYHVGPIITRFGPARPAMGLGGYKTPVPGLYVSGSGTHPIAGLNGTPGINAAETLLRNLRTEGPASRSIRAGNAAAERADAPRVAAPAERNRRSASAAS